MSNWSVAPLFVAYFTGYPGAGKTSFARALSEVSGGMVLNSDEARSSMFGDYANADDILRSDERRFYDDVHGALFYAAQQALEAGTSVIIDAQLSRHADRVRVKSLGDAAGAVPILIWMQTSRDVSRKRSMTRRDDVGSRRFNAEEIEMVFKYADARMETPRADEPVLPLDGEMDPTLQLRQFWQYLHDADENTVAS